jgi:SAM-dependent methyltransferase
MTFFDNAYLGVPTWDIDRPQGAVVRLAAAGLIEGSVLDVGCGTGENALFVAALGHEVLGVDLAAAAIAKAEARARERRCRAAFLRWDALRLDALGRRFDTALDIGLFHCLQPWQRRPYAASLHGALNPGGRCYLLCWSDRNPFGRGPERVTRSAIRAAFRGGWTVESIEPESLETRLPEGSVHAWLARLRRGPDRPPATRSGQEMSRQSGRDPGVQGSHT